MNLMCTTITGADQFTDVEEMIRIARIFRNVEFGILISEKKAGSPRYPEKQWVIEAAQQFMEQNMHPRFSYHICGSMSRDFVTGVVDFAKWDKFMPPLQFAQRIQVNVNLSRTPFNSRGMATLVNSIQHMYDECGPDGYKLQYIIQDNEANKNAWFALMKHRITPHVLYDASGGRGERAKELYKPIAGLVTGYSGGYDPENIGGVLKELDSVVGEGIIWVDVETGVRTNDNQMDMEKVYKFCTECSPYYLW